MFRSFFFFFYTGKKNFLDKILKKKYIARHYFSYYFLRSEFFYFLKLGTVFFHFEFFSPKCKIIFEKKKNSIIFQKIMNLFIREKFRKKKIITNFCARKKIISNTFFSKFKNLIDFYYIEESKNPKKKNSFNLLIQKEIVFLDINLFLNLFFSIFFIHINHSFVWKSTRMKIFFCERKILSNWNIVQKNPVKSEENTFLKKGKNSNFTDSRKIHLMEKDLHKREEYKYFFCDFSPRKSKNKIIGGIRNFLSHISMNSSFLITESSLCNLTFNKIFEKRKICSNQIFLNGNIVGGGKKFLKINGKNYLKIQKIGEGGSGKVFKIIDENCEVLALKKIKILNHDPDILHTCLNEISILKTLIHQPRVVQLKNADISLNKGYVLIVLEFGESDFENIIRKEKKGITDTVLLKFFWKQTLEAVQTIHEERIIHGDLKPSNFLLIEQSLKIIDFGTAKQIQKNTTNITRSLRIGTLNYMSPEAMVDVSLEKDEKNRFKIGRSADIWSLGCILYQMVYGNPPFYHLDFVKKIQAIIDKTYEIYCLPTILNFVVDVIKGCLQKNPDFRPSILELLNHPFLVTTNLFKFKKNIKFAGKG